MSAPIAPLTGDALLIAVTHAMIALHERYHHRVPVTAKTLLLGNDLLGSVLGGVYTDVEALSGRSVLAFISNQHVGPDLETELFMLASASDVLAVLPPLLR